MNSICQENIELKIVITTGENYVKCFLTLDKI
jgi:hypothetical protein